MRRTYIENNDMSVFDIYLSSFKSLEVEKEIIKTSESLDNVTSKAIYAKKCDPLYNASAMDGIAVDSNLTPTANEQNPLVLKEGIDFVYVNTGNPIDSRFNSVIMIENVLVNNDNTVSIIEPSYPWQNIRVKGESIVEGQMVVPSNHKIRPQDIGAIIASANIDIEVYKKVRVGIIPTGNEMVNDVNDLKVGKLMESNSKMFSSSVISLNGISKIYDICLDDKEMLKERLLLAAKENDLVIINAGSSAGTKDFTVEVLEEIGEVYAHGFAIKPGKPTILAKINNKPVIGIPGYPVSAFLVFDLFVKPLILKMSGLKINSRNKLKCRLTRNIVSSLKNAEYVRMNIGYVNNEFVATPLEKGAAQIMSLVKADGLLYIDKNSEGYNEGSIVDIELLKDIDEIKNNLLVIGSHDLIIDVLSDKLNISSAHVGSMGGIIALTKNETHIAPIHLLADDGTYNIPYIKKYFKDRKMVLIKGVGRIQGIMQNNDTNITSIKEISDNHISFANRQYGSGTRMLFDHLLKENSISSSNIYGYEKEYSTHLSVGVAIENNSAKCGIGIKSVANILGLKFVEIAKEEYDFLTTYENYQDKRVQEFIELLKSKEIKDKFIEFKDYDVSKLGEVIIIEC